MFSCLTHKYVTFVLQEWTPSEILVMCRLVRSLIAAAGLQSYNIAIFADSVESQLTTDFKTQVVYYHNKTASTNSKYMHMCMLSCKMNLDIIP